MYINPCLDIDIYTYIYIYIHDGLSTEALPGVCGPSQSGRIQAGRPPLLLHRTWPRPLDRAIAGAGGPFKLYSPRSRSQAGSDTVTEAIQRYVCIYVQDGLGTEALPGACGPSQSGRLQAGRPPLLLHRTWPRPLERAIRPESIVPLETRMTAREHSPQSHDTAVPQAASSAAELSLASLMCEGRSPAFKYCEAGPAAARTS